MCIIHNLPSATFSTLLYSRYTEAKKLLGERAAALKAEGDELFTTFKAQKKQSTPVFSRAGRNLRQREEKFKREALLLDYQYTRLEESYHYQRFNVLWMYIKLLGGIIG